DDMSIHEYFLDENVNRLEKDLIMSALEKSRGFITEAAEHLGTTRRILKYKMDKMGIDKKLFKK
ncbi:MAG: hypothetical protein JW928_07460, partial [Candidatus Aureabacteria bacterium]|nr:hypothetical protein [Candidatus Auribacterota bacterium]